MASRPPEVTQQAARNAAIVALAGRDLARLWPRVDWASDRAVNAVTTVYRAIVARYGAASASIAAEYYDDLRARQQLSTGHRAVPADPVPEAQVVRIVESAFQGRSHVRVVALDDDAAAVADHVTVATTSELPVAERVQTRLEGSLSKLVQQPARDTIAENVAADPAGPTWIRVPTGETTCEFCIMLASRELGARFGGYSSQELALFDENGQTFHKGCDCVAVPIYPGQNAHDVSPHLRDYKRIYDKGVKKAGTHSDAKAILAGMRQVLKDEQPPAVEAAPAQPEPIDLDVPVRRIAAGGGSGGEPPQPPRQDGPISDDDETPEQRLNRLFADQTNGANEAQKFSVEQWQRKDNDRFYQDVQRAAADNPRASLDARIVASDLDALMAPLPEDIEVWRGVRNARATFGVPSEDLESLAGGDPADVGRFFATTLNRAVADPEFIEPGSDPVLYKITALAGTYALWVPPLGNPDEAYQQELLFPPGAQVRIVGVDRTYRVPIVEVEVS